MWSGVDVVYGSDVYMADTYMYMHDMAAETCGRAWLCVLGKYAGAQHVLIVGGGCHSSGHTVVHGWPRCSTEHVTSLLDIDKRAVRIELCVWVHRISGIRNFPYFTDTQRLDTCTQHLPHQTCIADPIRARLRVRQMHASGTYTRVVTRVMTRVRTYPKIPGEHPKNSFAIEKLAQ
eukprot:1392033-Amorphochlora_amoeboformis.AAC.4